MTDLFKVVVSYSPVVEHPLGQRGGRGDATNPMKSDIVGNLGGDCDSGCGRVWCGLVERE